MNPIKVKNSSQKRLNLPLSPGQPCRASALDSHTAVQQVTPGLRNGCYLDTISRECRESHCYLYCVSSVFVSKVERSRWVFLISCTTWRGHGWEAWFITSETTQSFTEQTLALCCWYKYPRTSFNILSHVNPTMSMICLHCGIRSELKMDVYCRENDSIRYSRDHYLRSHQSIRQNRNAHTTIMHIIHCSVARTITGLAQCHCTAYVSKPVRMFKLFNC